MMMGAYIAKVTTKGIVEIDLSTDRMIDSKATIDTLRTITVDTDASFLSKTATKETEANKMVNSKETKRMTILRDEETKTNLSKNNANIS